MSGRRIDFYEVASGHEVGIDHYRMLAFSLHHANSATVGVVDRDIRKLVHLEVSQANHFATLSQFFRYALPGLPKSVAFNLSIQLDQLHYKEVF